VAITPPTVAPRPSFSRCPPVGWSWAQRLLGGPLGGGGRPGRPGLPLRDRSLNIPVLTPCHGQTVGAEMHPACFAGPSGSGPSRSSHHGAIGRRCWSSSIPAARFSPGGGARNGRFAPGQPGPAAGFFGIAASMGPALPTSMVKKLRRVSSIARTRGPADHAHGAPGLPARRPPFDLDWAHGFAVQRLSRQACNRPTGLNRRGGGGPGPGSLPVRPGPPGGGAARDQSWWVSHRPVLSKVVGGEPPPGGKRPFLGLDFPMGSWDDPESFEGWASHLASHATPCCLPRHPQ